MKSILASGLDKADGERREPALPAEHANLRGAEYYAAHSHIPVTGPDKAD